MSLGCFSLCAAVLLAELRLVTVQSPLAAGWLGTVLDFRQCSSRLALSAKTATRILVSRRAFHPIAL